MPLKAPFQLLERVIVQNGHFSFNVYFFPALKRNHNLDFFSLCIQNMNVGLGRAVSVVRTGICIPMPPWLNPH